VFFGTADEIDGEYAMSMQGPTFEQLKNLTLEEKEALASEAQKFKEILLAQPTRSDDVDNKQTSPEELEFLTLIIEMAQG